MPASPGAGSCPSRAAPNPITMPLPSAMAAAQVLKRTSDLRVVIWKHLDAICGRQVLEEGAHVREAPSVACRPGGGGIDTPAVVHDRVCRFPRAITFDELQRALADGVAAQPVGALVRRARLIAHGRLQQQHLYAPVERLPFLVKHRGEHA